ncbi:MAG: DMT family transporter [Methanocorpusculum sp.]|nr:DMT family transporter [Methanocorpusculum sp.]
MSKRIKGTIQLTLTSLIWGIAFVAQSVGMDYVGPWTFNCVRAVLAAVFLIPVAIITTKLSEKNNDTDTSDAAKKDRFRYTVIAGILSGLCLSSASLFQQYGIIETSVGKAGFITALYIIIVPFLSIFLKKKIGLNQWISALIAVAGFYIMSISGLEKINHGDLLLLVCAFLFSAQILVIDHFVDRINPVAMSCVQFFVAAIVCSIGMFALEAPTFDSLMQAKIPILYAGIMSSGVAYTLQIIGQKNLPPTPASLLMSLESVFSALAGFVILHQLLSAKEILGCVLVFAGVIISQLPAGKKRIS